MNIESIIRKSATVVVSAQTRRLRCTCTRLRMCWAGLPTISAGGSTPDSTVTYIIDRNVNYTNVCVAKCNFCAFYRDVGSIRICARLRRIFRKIDETIEVGGVQLLLQGGHNPDLPLTLVRGSCSARSSHGIRISSCTRCRRPRSFTCRGFPSSTFRRSSIGSSPQGLDSIPGGGAEILVDRVRRLLHCYGKATADEWLDVMRLRTAAVSDDRDDDVRHGRDAGRAHRAHVAPAGAAGRNERLHRIHFLELSARAHGSGRHRATGVDYLRTLALARIELDNFDNIQASWVTQGRKIGQLSLLRRQRHGQPHDRRERRPGGRSRVPHGRNRDRAQRRGRGLYRQAAEHALRRTWRSIFRCARCRAC